jgi:uncharacterized protein (TIGR00251 family)
VKNGIMPLVIHVRLCRATFLFTGATMPDISGAIAEEGRGAVIAIEVTPNARKSAFPAGYNEWRRTIGCRVSAPAYGGKANKSVLALIAGTLDLPVSSVSILSGTTSSQKRVLVTGIGMRELLVRLNRVR